LQTENCGFNNLKDQKIVYEGKNFSHFYNKIKGQYDYIFVELLD